jgi:hypothetical protein
MPRVHLFEWEDQPWFPALIRDAGTAYLELTQSMADTSEGIAEKLAPVVRETETDRIVDLCSGGSGPVRRVAAALARRGLPVGLSLTDRFPNLPALDRIEAEDPSVDCVREPVNCMAVPRERVGLRTLFNALHHFRPEDARRVLQDAVDAGQPIATFEVIGRRPIYFVGISFAWLTTLLLMPLVRPVRWQWLAFTYLVPLIPLFILWDGFVSCLRTYSPAELQSLVDGLEGEPYTWEIGCEKLGHGVGPVTYLIGIPRR